ncbi:uncharacterized protein AB675_6402 [Cyphellophora attinorum]|uniref:Transcription factor domain-containing protein n=1 Tax=Cyphellophora attinorum TaxID=1664694 RepID=A0A0N0NQI1_9EURO|nr:uncharacterized protein AB675_6402 [Phialophora attinorum]KPI43729.1 hypothetical protein AB675_6402 [Phialophora attinorum]
MATLIRHQHHPFHSGIDPTLLLMPDKKPNKDTSPAFFKGDFSFVNKDANNIDSKDHNAAVSWHVMNRYERFKKQEQARKLRASANVPTSSRSPNPRRRASTSTSRSRQSLAAGDRSNTDIPLDFSTDTQGVEAFGSDHPGSGIGCHILANLECTITTESQSFSASKPQLDRTFSAFDATQHDIPEPADVSTILSFAYETYLPNMWPTEPGNVQSSHEISRSWEDIAAISSDDCYDASFLALLLTVMSETNTDTRLKYQSRLYQSQAMGQLRQRLSAGGSQDLLTMKAILALFSSETCTDSTSTARVHLKSLKNLVMASGGVILLDSWFREDLLSADCYFALKFNTRPLFPASDWTPGPLSQPWKARLVSAGIFGDHAAGVDKRVEHPILKTTIMDLRELFRAQEYILTHEVPPEDQLLRWRQLRRFDCISRLADHCTSLAIYGHLYDLPKTQTMITLAVVLLVNMIMGSVLEYETDEKEVSGLAEDSDGTDDDKVLMWALYIGSLAERVHPQTEDMKEWFNIRMKQAVQRLRLNGWEDIKKILRHLLFSMRLHEEIVSGRVRREKDFCTGIYSICGTSWRRPLMLERRGESSSAGGSAGEPSTTV